MLLRASYKSLKNKKDVSLTLILLTFLAPIESNYSILQVYARSSIRSLRNGNILFLVIRAQVVRVPSKSVPPH